LMGWMRISRDCDLVVDVIDCFIHPLFAPDFYLDFCGRLEEAGHYCLAKWDGSFMPRRRIFFVSCLPDIAYLHVQAVPWRRLLVAKPWNVSCSLSPHQTVRIGFPSPRHTGQPKKLDAVDRRLQNGTHSNVPEGQKKARIGFRFLPNPSLQ
jgi:hypothetical protein